MSFSFIEFFVRLNGKDKGHTGAVGAYEFKDGVSVRKLHRNEAQVLPAIGFPCDAIDDDGKGVFEVIPGQVPMPDEAVEEVRAKFIASRSIKTVESKSAESKEPVKDDVSPDSVEETTDEPVKDDKGASTEKVTREQLEAIADKKGLKGLREVASEVGVKGKSIPELIERILNKQG